MIHVGLLPIGRLNRFRSMGQPDFAIHKLNQHVETGISSMHMRRGVVMRITRKPYSVERLRSHTPYCMPFRAALSTSILDTPAIMETDESSQPGHSPGFFIGPGNNSKSNPKSLFLRTLHEFDGGGVGAT